MASEPVRDKATVTSAGESLGALPHGLKFHPVTTHLDERGAVCELFDPRWNWHPDPIVFVYSFTIRAGKI